MRVYLPATLPLLADWLAAGQANVVDHAYAVTPTLREWYREADLDELEHAAQIAAGVGSLRLLDADPAAPRRRVVLAVDVDDADLRPDPAYHRAAVSLSGPVPKQRWGSGLIDETDATLLVEAAAARVLAALAGDDDAQFTIDELEDRDLGWYAVQELVYLTE